MARTFNMHEAKTHLSRLVERVRRGEEVVISKAGHPVARVVPYEPPRRTIGPPGSMKGDVWMSDDFDAPIDYIFSALQQNPGTKAR